MVELYCKVTIGYNPRYVVFGFASGGTDPSAAFPTFPINLLLMKAQRLIGSMGTSRGEHIQEMFGMVRDGRLNPGVSGGDYTLETWRAGYGDVASRRAIGKIVIRVATDSARL